MLNNLVCPVSTEKVSSYVSRLTVFMNVILLVIYLITLKPLLLFVVTMDYAVRAFGYNQYSPLCFIANVLMKLSGVKPKMTDKAPKIFASRLGLICAILGFLFILSGFPISSRVITGIFTVLALLDSVFDFCAGCVIYHKLVFPFYERQNQSA